MRYSLRAFVILSACVAIPACTGDPLQNSSASGPTWQGTPTGVSGTGGTAGTATLNWSAAIDNSGTGITYSVFQGLTSGGEDMNTVVASTSTTSTVVSSLTVHDTYYFVIVATDGNGNSDTSPEFQVTATP